MKILIIDNTIDTDSWGSPELRRFGRLVPGADIHVRRAPHGDLPSSPAAFDRIIVSGSKTAAEDDAPWIDDLLEFIRRSIDLKKPYLGVCYGHQMLVRALGGKGLVRRAAEAEYGWTKIEILEEDPAKNPLMKGLQREFYSFSSHFDEVSDLPKGMIRLAQSDDCAIQACRIDGQPVFGIQFHPEKNGEEADRTLANRKKLGTPKRLLHFGKTPKFYKAEIGDTIFRNFFEI